MSHEGRRCTERRVLEFHHVTPYAAGGVSTADNIQLRCRAHNGYEAERYFGPRTPPVVREPGGSYSIPHRAAAPGGCGPVTRSGPSDQARPLGSLELFGSTGSRKAAAQLNHALERPRAIKEVDARAGRRGRYAEGRRE